MTRVTWAAIAAGLAALLSSGPSSATPADTSGTLYRLVTPPSALEVGCFGPCECPVQLFPTFGSFELVLTSIDPLFRNYAVRNYIASFNNGPGAVAITGSGRYRIGGEVALMQQMTLDLDIEGRPTEHFDSGLVPVGAPFPDVDVSLSVHGFACLDSVVVVNAKPIGTTDVPPFPAPRFALTSVKPNPFHGGTVIAWTMPRPGTFELTIVDLGGRKVRELAHGAAPSSEDQSVTWDGKRDDGRMAAAGVYWVWLHGPNGSDRRRIVKLE